MKNAKVVYDLSDSEHITLSVIDGGVAITTNLIDQYCSSNDSLDIALDSLLTVMMQSASHGTFIPPKAVRDAVEALANKYC